MNVISCGDDFVEDTGGGSIPPEEIITPPVYMLLDGPYKSGVVLTRNEDDSYIIELLMEIRGLRWRLGRHSRGM